ncbi:MAG: helix-turn-helix domain-containing protein [Acidobacteriales bacterium]|nr:helix-turn-helix domain-containing protein [Terriglobales bacterium]
MDTVGKRIRKLREEKRLTLDQLSERTGISKGFLSDAENGNRNMSSQNLLKIANELNASLDFLLRGAEVAPPKPEPLTIPPELTEAARELDLSFAQTEALLAVHRSVVARRSNEGLRTPTVQDWKEMYKSLKKFLV